ncbi:MAG: helix-turn-helix transcriptional regulator [Nitrososphaerota archaeon]|jgi:DNA-binding PadR family transcriptional regulator|nr:helix-turn-helix transcriptional regulator [Nitrososphaerota archaeon]
MLTVKQTQERVQGSEGASNLAKQLVDIEILYLLTFGPKSGYELKKQLQNWFKIGVSYGTLYPHLHSLESIGYVTGKWQQKFETAPLKKRTYTLTHSGEETLRGSIESLTKIALTMQFMMTRVDMGTLIPSANENKISLERAERFFIEHDYNVKKSVTINGFSGVKYLVDMLAIRPENQRSKVIIRIVDGKPLTIDDILKTHVMSFDLEAGNSIVLSPYSISEEISKLAKFYRISVFGGENLESATGTMCSSYKV